MLFQCCLCWRNIFKGSRSTSKKCAVLFPCTSVSWHVWSCKRTTYFSRTLNRLLTITLEGASWTNKNVSVTFECTSHVFNVVFLPIPTKKDVESLRVNVWHTVYGGALNCLKVAIIVCAAIYLWRSLHQMISRLQTPLKCLLIWREWHRCRMSWSPSSHERHLPHQADKVPIFCRLLHACIVQSALYLLSLLLKLLCLHKRWIFFFLKFSVCSIFCKQVKQLCLILMNKKEALPVTCHFAEISILLLSHLPLCSLVAAFGLSWV